MFGVIDKGADIPASPSRYPHTPGFVAAFCFRNTSGSARTSFVGFGEKPVSAADTRSVTGVGRGPSNARPYAVAPSMRRFTTFILIFVEYSAS
jgi:hypothetical protein